MRRFHKRRGNGSLSPLHTLSMLAIEKPKWVLLFWLLCLVLLSPGLLNLTLDSDYKQNFSASSPELQAMERIQEQFAQPDSLIFLIDADEASLFTKERLTIIKEISDEAQSLPYATLVSSITSTYLIDSDPQSSDKSGDMSGDIIIEPLITDIDSLTSKQLSEIADKARSSDAIQGKLLSAGLDATLIIVSVEVPQESSHSSMRNIYRQAENIVNRYTHRDSDLTIYLSGTVAGNQAFFDIALHDLTHLIPISYLLIIALTLLFLGGIANLIIVLSVITVTNCLTFAIRGWVDPVLTANDTFAPTAIMTIAMADCVHILNSRWREIAVC